MKGRTIHRAYNLGDPIMVGTRDGFETKWELGTITQVFPMHVLVNGATFTEHHQFLIRKPELGTVAPDKVAPVLDPEMMHRALVAIIREGDTQTPNATVKRIVNLAKEAIGELTT